MAVSSSSSTAKDEVSAVVAMKADAKVDFYADPSLYLLNQMRRHDGRVFAQCRKAWERCNGGKA